MEGDRHRVDQAIAEKRAAQFDKLGRRLQPAGYTRESFVGRTGHKLDAARLKQVNDFVQQMREEFTCPELPSASSRMAR